MLHDGKLGEHFSVEHLEHALVDLAPTVADPRDVEEDRRVLPERTLLDVVDEANGGEVHVGLAVVVDVLGDVCGARSTADGAFQGCWLVGVDWTGELG